MKKQKYLFTTLAVYQTQFWIEICSALQRLDVDCAVISFDDRSTMLLHQRGIETIDVISESRNTTIYDECENKLLQDFGIDDVNYVYGHEREAFGLIDHARMRKKFLAYAIVIQRNLHRLKCADIKVVLFQELGGFIAVLAALSAAKKAGIDNIFLEPSFFRGRLFFSRNSLSAPKVPPNVASVVSPEVADYVRRTLDEKKIVIPKKDRHHYAHAIKKILNRRNVIRLLQKLYDAKVLGLHQEFGHNLRHVKCHLLMLYNSRRIRSLVAPLPASGEYIYFPLHVPGDVALTLRSPEYLDQLALVDYVARSLPLGTKLVIKEHPATIGALDAGRLKRLLKRFDNVALSDPDISNFDIMKHARGVISINSKSGAEALLLGRTVLVLGDAFYSDCPFVQRVSSLAELPTALARLPVLDQPQELIIRYFQTVYEHTLLGELYAGDTANIEDFAKTIVEIAEHRGGPAS